MDYRQYFVVKERRDGTTFTCLIDNAPVELTNLIHDIHREHFFHCMPIDWFYKTIRNAFEELHVDPIEDITIESDPYNFQLTKWLHENCDTFANEYCTEWLEDCCLIGSKLDMMAIISGAQQLAKERIYHAVNDWIQEQKGVTE